MEIDAYHSSFTKVCIDCVLSCKILSTVRKSVSIVLYKLYKFNYSLQVLVSKVPIMILRLVERNIAIRSKNRSRPFVIDAPTV